MHMDIETQKPLGFSRTVPSTEKLSGIQHMLSFCLKFALLCTCVHSLLFFGRVVFSTTSFYMIRKQLSPNDLM